MAQNKIPLELIVSQLLTRQNKTIAVAESCSGGLISHRLTNIPGSSNYLKLSIVAYSPDAKVALLKIPEEKIKRYGIVSKEIALLMAENIRKLACANIGLGITGIAGPGGGSKLKPVGLVYIAYASEEKKLCNNLLFRGDRQAIKHQASETALSMLKSFLEHK